MEDIIKQAEVLREQTISDRRWLHEHAEVAFKEYETSDWIYEQLKKMPELEVSRPCETGVYAVLRTGRPGKTIAVRAETDALPMPEETGLPYASRNPGVMHSCGHDGHTAALLNAIRILLKHRDELNGELRFIFQHAEELPPGGAVDMIRAGCMDGVDEVFGYHFTSTMQTGTFGICPGVMTSATDRFVVTVKGKGGHSSMPEACVDPVVIGAQIILAYQTIVSRRMNPRETAVLSVCSAEAASAYNIIPHEMRLEGSIRTFSEEVRESFKRQLEEIARGIARANGGDIEFEFHYGYGSVVNDIAMTKMGEELIRRTFGDDAIVYLQPLMPGDDYSYYAQLCPSFYCEIGAGNKEKGITAPHHNPKYLMDEDVLPLAVEYVATLVLARAAAGKESVC